MEKQGHNRQQYIWSQNKIDILFISTLKTIFHYILSDYRFAWVVKNQTTTVFVKWQEL